MVSLRFAGLLLGFLLVFQGPNYARGIKKEEVIDGISATEFGKGGQLGGRKMGVMEKDELNAQGQKNGERTSRTSSKTTGLSEARLELELEEGCNINKDESQSRVLVEEVMQLMGKDYSGRPHRRKPPTQN